MAILGIFKSREEKDRDAVIAMMKEVGARAVNVIAYVEGKFSPAQRKSTAEHLMLAVMGLPRTMESVDKMQARIRQLNEEPEGEGPTHFGIGLASYLVIAWCSLDTLKGKNWLLSTFWLTTIEGALKGFIERAGVAAWKSSYIEDRGAFERERTEFLTADQPA